MFLIDDIIACMKKFLFLLFLLSLALILVLWRNSISSNSSSDKESSSKVEETVLYVSDSCSYCKKVEDWLISRPEVATNSGLLIKEVSGDQNNAKELLERAKDCNKASTGGVSVPFLYSDGQCFVGETEIEVYLEGSFL